MKASRLDLTLLPAEELQFLRRIAGALLVLFLFFALFATLHRFYSEKFFRITGEANWIWSSQRLESGKLVGHELKSGKPIVFFAVRDFVLHDDPGTARIKVFGDPEYTLFMNGVRLGGRRTAGAGPLDLYDVSAVAKKGVNRVVAAVRSEKGVGGFLFALDASPTRQNVLISDGRWKIFHSWSERLPFADPTERPQSASVAGRPPFGRWNFLPLSRTAIVPSPVGSVTQPGSIMPRHTRRVATAQPEIRSLSGVAVVVRVPVVATLFDFGPVQGYGRLAFPANEQRLVRVRYINDPSELSDIDGTFESFVLARGERLLTDPEKRAFRYMAVFATDVNAVVITE
ncbi:MAG TPA: hypothetical protein VNM92_09100 [Thermoanaerobaculia bacterium]|nr:hypothetical protein [Thermoanaerobaculia bacterium]